MAPPPRAKRSRRRYVIKPDAPKPKVAAPVVPTVAQPAVSNVVNAAPQQAAAPQTPKLPEQQVTSMKTSVPQPPSHTPHPEATPAAVAAEQVPAETPEAAKSVTAASPNAHSTPAAPKAVVTKSFLKKKKPKMAFLFDDAPSKPEVSEAPQETHASVAAETAEAAHVEAGAAEDAPVTDQVDASRGEEVKQDATPVADASAAEPIPAVAAVASPEPSAAAETVVQTQAPAAKVEESPASQAHATTVAQPKRPMMKLSRALAKKRHAIHAKVDVAPKASLLEPEVSAKPVSAEPVADAAQSVESVSQVVVETQAAAPVESVPESVPQTVEVEQVEPQAAVAQSEPVAPKKSTVFGAAAQRNNATNTRLSYLEGLQATDDYISTISLSSAAEPHLPDAEYNEAEVMAYYLKAARNNRRIRRSPPDKKQRKLEARRKREEMMAKKTMGAEDGAAEMETSAAAPTESEEANHVEIPSETTASIAPKTADAPQGQVETEIPAHVDAALPTEAPAIAPATSAHKLSATQAEPVQAAHPHHHKRISHKITHTAKEVRASAPEKVEAAPEKVAAQDVATEHDTKTSTEGMPKNPKLSFLFEEDVKPLPIATETPVEHAAAPETTEAASLEAGVDATHISEEEEVTSAKQAEEIPEVSEEANAAAEVSHATPSSPAVAVAADADASAAPLPKKQQQRVATNNRLTKKMKKLRQKAVARKATYKSAAATEIDEATEAAEVAEEIEGELAQRRAAATQAEKEAGLVAARQSMSKPGNILNDAHLFHHVAVKSGVVEKPEVASTATASVTAARPIETVKPSEAVSATATPMGSAEALVAESSLVFPDHGVEIQTFTDSEMVIARPGVESPWDIGLRFDWGSKQLAMGSLPAIPASDARMKHPYMKLYQSRPMWFLKEVNGTPATKIHNVMEVMKQSVRVHFVFKK